MCFAPAKLVAGAPRHGVRRVLACTAVRDSLCATIMNQLLSTAFRALLLSFQTGSEYDAGDLFAASSQSRMLTRLRGPRTGSVDELP